MGDSRQGRVLLYDLQTATRLTSFSHHKTKVNAVAVPPCGTFVVSGGHDSSVQVWVNWCRFDLPLNNWWACKQYGKLTWPQSRLDPSSAQFLPKQV